MATDVVNAKKFLLLFCKFVKRLVFWCKAKCAFFLNDQIQSIVNCIYCLKQLVVLQMFTGLSFTVKSSSISQDTSVPQLYKKG